MTLAALFTLAVILGALALMLLTELSPDLVLLGAVVGLAAVGILEPADAFAGFANPGMLTVAALFVVAAGLRETGVVTKLTSGLLGRPSTTRGALWRLVPPVIAASSVLNNTAVVATMLPAVHDWARRIGVAPSRLLLPLSYASILGGVCTLIGTSTNLVVAGLVEELRPTYPGLVTLGMFDITPLGVVVAGAGALVLVVLGPVLLPDRRPPVSQADDPRHYTMELLVPPGSRLAGLALEDAGLRHLPGAYLMEVVRGEEVLVAVDGHLRLHENDRLVFVGDVDAMVDLQRFPGLAAAPNQVFKLTGDRSSRLIVEAVVSSGNPLVGRTIRDGRFRSQYQAAVIAVARAGERLGGRIGDIVLHAGDVLLLEAHRSFISEHRSRSDFVLVSSVDGASPPRFERAWVAGVVLAAMVALVTLNLLSTVVAAFLAAGAMVVTRCCSVEEARRSLDLTVLVAIASAFGLGRAMQVSELDVWLAQWVSAAGGGQPFAALVAVYLITALLTELITNNAAAVLVLPMALSLAHQLGAAPMPYVYAVMVAASASFLTPIGYQTNLMVYNAGGYRASDYPRVGLPLSLTVAAVTLALIPRLWPL
jgi:di/tricarboxylate transporter